VELCPKNNKNKKMEEKFGVLGKIGFRNFGGKMGEKKGNKGLAVGGGGAERLAVVG
jgi:hypothetical protein